MTTIDLINTIDKIIKLLFLKVHFALIDFYERSTSTFVAKYLFSQIQGFDVQIFLHFS